MRCCRPALVVLPLTLTGCTGWQSSLDPQGPQADTLATMFWVFTAILAVVWLLTMAALFLSLRRARAERAGPLVLEPQAERSMTRAVSVAVAFTAAIVIALTVVSYAAQRALFSSHEAPLTLLVKGHQWWWEVTYEDGQPSRRFTTANEIHVPVGQPVLIKLQSSDVIHSFWVPSLAGKMDIIPGRENRLVIEASKDGIFRGQCAEFCGWQHAHMAIAVVAHSAEEFERWRDNQISAAEPPDDPLRKRGMEIFLTRPCVMCHQIRGTPAAGKVAPDLTHVGSRLHIAAGTLPNSRGNLAAWIADPQGIKPGAHMPLMKLAAGEIEPLTRYLEGLR
ncbi:cytochrome c oxidase subunit II [Sinorhizobium medicae]|uniref:cytochrome-c oxidase n=1 Tax=Sinorhizobium medicae TaxID=110321 RepID=A0A6G1WIX9_9HYPH|nr:cytochrome c oxidase subunit II [Sinorhizobium medicae]MQW00456.1 cytochrome c oxidase subunit II [Sinorhizobium medicae]MQW69597.1 cytochrome c oxidase subunit II [Sinorhizobium medicae]MQW69603.1 cytochrome c oxidase subunit II [Sinorhizobium medicae]MQW72063.1 cytochrome c oxidase subunit II [Sinorhizobium medicae]MQW73616.1 cytochrome c oxidase subunit II [Sinorhizobium medicae]